MIARARPDEPDDGPEQGPDTDFAQDPSTIDEPISESRKQESADKPYWTKRRIATAVALIGTAAVGIAEAVRFVMQHKE